MNLDVQAYNNSQSAEDKLICNTLAEQINLHLTEAENKIWHAHPVWFLEGNPIVGYDKLKDCVRVLFWSGQSFDEEKLVPNGSFQAAQLFYTTVDDINTTDLERRLGKSQTIQREYKNIVKRKGKLEKLTAF